MAQAQTQDTVETIADAGLWKAIVEAVNEVGLSEAVFEFNTDGLQIAVKDAANVALCRQAIDADAFEHYAVSESFRMGVDTQKLEDLIKVAGSTEPFRFDYDFETFSFAVEFEDVYTEMAGLDVESVNGKVEEMPGVKDELPYSIDVTLPVDKWAKATDVIELSGDGHATFRMGGEDGVFKIEGTGDTDKTTVTIHEDDRFEWNDPAPDQSVEMVQSNDYMTRLVGLIDEDTVRFVAGEEVPYHVWTTRQDAIDTKLMQAPRIVSD